MPPKTKVMSLLDKERLRVKTQHEQECTEKNNNLEARIELFKPLIEAYDDLATVKIVVRAEETIAMAAAVWIDRKTLHCNFEGHRFSLEPSRVPATGHITLQEEDKGLQYMTVPDAIAWLVRWVAEREPQKECAQ